MMRWIKLIIICDYVFYFYRVSGFDLDICSKQVYLRTLAVVKEAQTKYKGTCILRLSFIFNNLV